MPVQLPGSPESLNTGDSRGSAEVPATPTRRPMRPEEGAATVMVAATGTSPLPPAKRDPAEGAVSAIFTRKG